MAKRWRIRPRFTLWAMLVLITVVAIPMAYVAKRRAWNLKRKAAMNALSAKGASFKYGGLASFMTKKPPPLTWWQRLCGDLEAFSSVEMIGNGTPGSAAFVDEDLRQMALLRELETVRLAANKQVTDEGLRSLAGLPHFKQFLGEGLPQVDGSFLESWTQSNTIEVLDFVRLSKLKGAHLKPLGKLTHLKSFSIYRCDNLEPADCEEVDLPPSILYLHLGRTPLGDNAIRRWLGQTELETLGLDVDCSRAIAPGLAKQTRLKSFQITNSPLIDEDLDFLEDCRNLEMLQLRGLPLDGSFLKKISNDSKLMLVYLESAPLKEENAVELCRFSKLRTLDLSWTPIHGEFLSAASWAKLTLLSLKGTQFSEQGKVSLAKLSIPFQVDYPANWTVLDLRRYQSVKPPTTPILNSAYAATSDGVATSLGVGFVAPQFQPELMSRCPADLMAPVIRLAEQARAPNDAPMKGAEE